MLKIVDFLEPDLMLMAKASNDEKDGSMNGSGQRTSQTRKPRPPPVIVERTFLPVKIWQLRGRPKY